MKISKLKLAIISLICTIIFQSQISQQISHAYDQTPYQQPLNKFLPYNDFENLYLWGSYKNQLLYSISQKKPDPITYSLMYYNPKMLVQKTDLRYKFADRKSIDQKYNFVYHDQNKFIIHSTKDPTYDVEFSNNFFKLQYSVSQEWVDILKNEQIQSQEQPINYVYNIGLENFYQNASSDTRYIEYAPLLNQDNAVKGVTITIKNSDNSSQEYFTLYSNNAKSVFDKSFIGYKLFESDIQQNWNMYDSVYNEIKNHTFKKENRYKNYKGKGTFISLIFTFNLTQAFELALHYSNEFPSFHLLDLYSEKQKRIQTFEDQFFKTFQNSTDEVFNRNKLCSMNSFTNLMGGLQYSYGNIKCEQNLTSCYTFKEMWTLTPSRLGFPRPFLWDEGFHTQLSCIWNPQQCLQDLTLWLGTQNEDGWIPREQPRGPELQSYIDWLHENPNEANPTTILFGLNYLVTLGGQFKEGVAKLVPKLENWFLWWQNTQKVKDNDLYLWWGPDDSTNLGSGMDDWPRISDDGKYVGYKQIDASSWALMLTGNLAHIYYNIGNLQKAREYGDVSENIRNQIFAQLRDKNTNLFFDLLKRQNDSSDTKLSNHFGSPNLVPLGLGIFDPVKDIQMLQAYAAAIMDNTTIWTQWGLRSLSKTDFYFGKNSNYWTGPIWVNIPYLVLRAIKLYYWEVPAMRNLYDHLRKTTVGNVCGNWVQDEYFSEISNQAKDDGAPAGNRPFNGWTSVITLIINEKYFPGNGLWNFDFKNKKIDTK